MNAFVLVGVDGSETSRLAFHEAVRQATWRNAEVRAVHVIGYTVMSGYAMMVPEVAVLRTSGETFLEKERVHLEEAYSDGFPVPVSFEVRIGHAGVQIIEAATDDPAGPAEIVVLGSRGFGGFRGLLLGSVTTYAVHHLEVPVLIVPELPETDSEEDGRDG